MSGPSFDHAGRAAVNSRPLLSLRPPFEPRTQALHPGVEGALDRGPGVEGGRTFPSAVDPRCQELVRLRIAYFTLDGRGLDEPAQLGIDRTRRRRRQRSTPGAEQGA